MVSIAMESLESAIGYLKEHLDDSSKINFLFACRWFGVYAIDPLGNIIKRESLEPVSPTPNRQKELGVTQTDIDEWVNAARTPIALHRLSGKPLSPELADALKK